MAKKENLVKIECAFCRGAGLDPFGIPSKMAKCQVCWGKGINMVAAAYEKCTACEGTGVFAHHRLVCAVCQGKGVVAKDRRKGARGLDRETGLPEMGNYLI